MNTATPPLFVATEQIIKDNKETIVNYLNRTYDTTDKAILQTSFLNHMTKEEYVAWQLGRISAYVDSQVKEIHTAVARVQSKLADIPAYEDSNDILKREYALLYLWMLGNEGPMCMSQRDVMRMCLFVFVFVIPDYEHNMFTFEYWTRDNVKLISWSINVYIK